MCMYANKRHVKNKTREIIAENKLWCINVVVDYRSNYAGEESKTVKFT